MRVHTVPNLFPARLAPSPEAQANEFVRFVRREIFQQRMVSRVEPGDHGAVTADQVMALVVRWAGGDPKRAKIARQVVLKGQTEGEWFAFGLPEITRETMDEIIRRLEETPD